MFLANSPLPEYQILSKNLKIARDFDELWTLTEDGIIKNGTHAFMYSFLSEWHKGLGKWWRGDLVLGNFPYGGYLSDKNWYLNEEDIKLSFSCNIFCN